MRAVFLVAAVVLVLVSAQTEPTWGRHATTSGNVLKGACGSKNKHDQGICLGFAIAIAAVVGDEPYLGWRACIPEGVMRAQVRDVMVKHLDDHPEKLHHNADSLVARAFAEAFPCPK